jgi:hypothetical protein
LGACGELSALNDRKTQCSLERQTKLKLLGIPEELTTSPRPIRKGNDSGYSRGDHARVVPIRPPKVHKWNAEGWHELSKNDCIDDENKEEDRANRYRHSEQPGSFWTKVSLKTVGLKHFTARHINRLQCRLSRSTSKPSDARRTPSQSP